MNTLDRINKYIAGPAIITLIVLLIPFVGMLVSEEVNWSYTDFIVAGVLLFGTGLAYKVISTNANHITYRIGAALAMGTGLFLIWANLAVGITGSEDVTFNLVYYAVLGVALIGVAASGLQAIKMAWAMFAAAGAQLIVAITALAMNMQDVPNSSVMEIAGINALFITLWVASGLFFQSASKLELTDSE
jgi:hypothetical protein